MWTTSTTFIRISTILLYLQVFPLPKFVVVCWIFMATNIAYALATYIAPLVICRPFIWLWDQSAPDGHCGDPEKFYLWHGTQNLLQDIILVAMPMPLLWTLQMPVFKKISLTLIFGMGIG
jgi:hypothetical protein